MFAERKEQEEECLSPRSPRQPRSEIGIQEYCRSGFFLAVLADLARDIFRLLVVASSCLLAVSPASAATPRARDIGIPLDGKPGPVNAITDVAGVEVGQVTLISGDGALKRGEGPVRTGVTAIIPRGKNSINPVFAGWATSNAAGEMTGTTWLEERGYFDGPIMITNTHSATRSSAGS